MNYGADMIIWYACYVLAASSIFGAFLWKTVYRKPQKESSFRANT
ncbi:hypothetical protein PQR62_17340 [Herbaspirillum lusitanum]|uniref:Heme exporter protein D n=1 Tax=Herbaspirillum lusitanum TaxID=213312 RepID=A0ABW9AAX1_9BURK